MESQKAASASSPSPSPSTLLLSSLPREKWRLGDLYKCEGFWYVGLRLPGVISARSLFEAREDDVILASSMKTGTTWLKAIIPTIFSLGPEVDPLLHNHPNELMPSLELQVFADQNPNLQYLSGSSIPSSPRLFRTHVPYHMLSESVKSSNCKIVYITRDPKDVFVSSYHFFNMVESYRGQGIVSTGDDDMEELFDCFCKGVHPYGPFHDHVLEYWNESLKRPHKILFLRYEELKSDPKGQVRKLASFIGSPLVKDEEVEEVLRRCSLERIKNLEVNQNGVDPWVVIPYKAYFRSGVVVDWKNHISPEMQDRLSKITRLKMEGSEFNFES